MIDLRPCLIWAWAKSFWLSGRRKPQLRLTLDSRLFLTSNKAHMKKFTVITALLMSIIAVGQAPKKQLSPEERAIKIERYKAYLIKKNRERDSIYKRGTFRVADTFKNKDSDIMKRVLREEELIKSREIPLVKIQSK